MDELVETVIQVAGKEMYVQSVERPVGVQARNFRRRASLAGVGGQGEPPTGD